MLPFFSFSFFPDSKASSSQIFVESAIQQVKPVCAEPASHSSLNLGNITLDSPSFSATSSITEPDHAELQSLDTDSTVERSTDPAKWIVNDETINFLLSKGSIDQNKQNFSETKMYYPKLNKYRSLTKNTFQRKMMNGEIQERKYLIYSPSLKSVFCISCRLFGGSSKLATEGCFDWSNIHKILRSHENSVEHNSCQIAFFNRSRAMVTNAAIDTELNHQIETEMNYWKNVLHRVIAVVKKLSSRGLAFRGKEERFRSKKNGNFLMCFDPFMATHINNYGNPGRGNVSYLSSSTYNEFISLIASRVRRTILDEIKCRKYYSIIVDSTLT